MRRTGIKGVEPSGTTSVRGHRYMIIKIGQTEFVVDDQMRTVIKWVYEGYGHGYLLDRTYTLYNGNKPVPVLETDTGFILDD